MNHNHFPAGADLDSDLEASSGLTNQERFVSGMDDAEQESGYHWMEDEESDEDFYSRFDDDAEDPLAGDVEPTGGYDGTEYVDVRDLEENEDEFGNAIDGHGNLINPDDELYDDNENKHPSREDINRPTTNVFIINLENAIEEAAAKQGIAEGDVAKIYGASFTLKDAGGNPTDKLRVFTSDYSGPLARPGVQGFSLAPINGEKDAYGRHKKFVDGHFSIYSSHPKKPEDSSYSMTYGGGSPEAIREYAAAALQPDVLARADVELEISEDR